MSRSCPGPYPTLPAGLARLRLGVAQEPLPSSRLAKECPHEPRRSRNRPAWSPPRPELPIPDSPLRPSQWILSASPSGFLLFLGSPRLGCLFPSQHLMMDEILLIFFF